MSDKKYCDKCKKEIIKNEYYTHTTIHQVYGPLTTTCEQLQQPTEEEGRKFQAQWRDLTGKDFCYDCISQIMI